MFWMDLTLALGHGSLAECRQRVNGVEFMLWVAYYKQRMLPEDREDYRSAMQVATLVNVNRAKGPPAKLTDFIPFQDMKNERRTRYDLTTTDQLTAALMSMTKAKGGKIKEPVNGV